MKRSDLPFKGGAVTLLLLVLLLSPPASLLDNQGTYAESQAVRITNDAVAVSLRKGLSQSPQLIPDHLGNWTSIADESNEWKDALKNSLDIDQLLVRHYTRPGFYVPVQLMVLSAENANAFHDPTVCFRVQATAGTIDYLDELGLPIPGAEEKNASMSRFTVLYDEDSGEAAKLVYNLYLIERRYATQERTTWIRLAFPGVNLNNTEALEPFMLDLMQEVTPYLFEASGATRTTWSWLDNNYGIGAALGATALAIMPVGIEGIVIWRKRS